MIPVWKLRRELLRIGKQLRELPARLSEPILKLRYDATRWDRVAISEGHLPLGSKLCLFLLYQPDALPDSVLSTARFLRENGYAVLVVANGGLSADARTACLPHCWRLLERPNFGYDFGGYRDGIHWLERQGVKPDQLMIVNDSIWWPLNQDSDVIRRLEAADYDVTGLLLHTRSRYEGLPEHGLKGAHIESYVTCLRRKVLDSEAFMRFWQEYRLSDSKHLTIRRGEIGFSKAMLDAGFTIGGLSQRSLFIQEIQRRDDSFLETTLRYAAYIDDDLEAVGATVLALPRDSAWRAAALRHIEEVVMRRRFNASFAYASEEIFRLSFHKKNREMMFRRSRLPFLRAVDDGAIQVTEVATLAEIRALSAQQEAN